MGRIRTKHIKSIGKRLYAIHKDVFQPDFEKNKKLADKYLELKSKRLRNFIAGYLTHLVNKSIEERSYGRKESISKELIDNAAKV